MLACMWPACASTRRQSVAASVGEQRRGGRPTTAGARATRPACAGIAHIAHGLSEGAGVGWRAGGRWSRAFLAHSDGVGASQPVTIVQYRHGSCCSCTVCTVCTVCSYSSPALEASPRRAAQGAHAARGGGSRTGTHGALHRCIAASLHRGRRPRHSRAGAGVGSLVSRGRAGAGAQVAASAAVCIKALCALEHGARTTATARIRPRQPRNAFRSVSPCDGASAPCAASRHEPPPPPARRRPRVCPPRRALGVPNTQRAAGAPLSSSSTAPNGRPVRALQQLRSSTAPSGGPVRSVSGPSSCYSPGRGPPWARRRSPAPSVWRRIDEPRSHPLQTPTAEPGGPRLAVPGHAVHRPAAVERQKVSPSLSSNCALQVIIQDNRSCMSLTSITRVSSLSLIPHPPPPLLFFLPCGQPHGSLLTRSACWHALSYMTFRFVSLV
jgi:hypothetical protein